MPQISAAAEILGAMITPSLLISASGTLVLSTSNRLSRVVDRVRVLTRDAETLPIELPEQAVQPKHALIATQLGSLSQRAVILRSALGSLYTAIGFLVATSVSIGMLTMTHADFSWPAVVLAMLGACALLWGSVLLVREVCPDSPRARAMPLRGRSASAAAEACAERAQNKSAPRRPRHTDCDAVVLKAGKPAGTRPAGPLWPCIEPIARVLSSEEWPESARYFCAFEPPRQRSFVSVLALPWLSEHPTRTLNYQVKRSSYYTCPSLQLDRALASS
jgi:hypothetical protein